MKKIIAILIYFLPCLLFAQQSVLVWHDEEVADTTINGFVETEIPFFTDANKNFINGLIKDVIDEKYKVYYRYSLDQANGQFQFPLLYAEHLSVIMPYPPYENVDSVINHGINYEDISKIRIYEKWTFNNWTFDQQGYTKTVLGWSFIFRNRVEYFSNGEYKEAGYDFNTSINPSAKVETYQFEPYLFLKDAANLDFIRNNLNYWEKTKGVERPKVQFSLMKDVDRPFAAQKLSIYDLYFPDTVRSNFESINDEPLDMPISRLGMMKKLFSDIVAGKFMQYNMDYLNLEYVGNKSVFPVIERDTNMVQSPNPPYDYVYEVYTYDLKPEDVVGIRYYEIRQSDRNLLDPNLYKKIAFSFLYLKKKPDLPNETRTVVCPYLFVLDENQLPYLAQKLSLKLIKNKK